MKLFGSLTEPDFWELRDYEAEAETRKRIAEEKADERASTVAKATNKIWEKKGKKE